MQTIKPLFPIGSRVVWHQRKKTSIVLERGVVVSIPGAWFNEHGDIDICYTVRLDDGTTVGTIEMWLDADTAVRGAA